MLYQIEESGYNALGVYEGESEEEALLNMFHDAGYTENQIWLEDGELSFCSNEMKEICGTTSNYIIGPWKDLHKSLQVEKWKELEQSDYRNTDCCFLFN